MPLWESQRRPGKLYTEAQLARRVGRGKLAFDDLVRPLGEEGWRPAGEAVSVPGGLVRAQQLHRWQLVQGLLWHVGVFAGVSYYAHLPPIAVMGWGIGVAAHALKTVGRLVWSGQRRLPVTDTGAVPAGAPAMAPARTAAALAQPRQPAAPSADPFLSELASVLDDLDRIARERDLPGSVDLAALRSSAQELRRRHLDLARIGDPATAARLTRERDDALAQAAAARDPRTVEVLRDQARSVNERLESMREATEAASRLEARERTLLHQVESLRLAHLRSGADEAPAAELGDEARRLQSDLKAEAEIDNALAAARLRAARVPEG